MRDFDFDEQMTIVEKIQHTDAFAINLYKEGVFWKAYEQSAYAIQQIRSYQAVKQYIKLVRGEVVHIGFPDSVLKDILPAFALVGRTEKEIRLKTSRPIDLQAFEVWKEALPLKEANPPQSLLHNGGVTSLSGREGSKESELNVLSKLRAFDLSNATPMQCMMFLSELKKGLAP